MRQVLEYLEDTLVSGPQLQNVRLLKVGTTCCTMMVHRISLNHPSMCSCLISSCTSKCTCAVKTHFCITNRNNLALARGLPGVCESSKNCPP